MHPGSHDTQKAFSCCDAILETGPAVSMRSEPLVAHENLGQLPLLRCARITVLIYCCVLTVYNTLYKFVTAERDGLRQTVTGLFYVLTRII